jgi:small subunit ribosomal protein S16
MLKIRLQRSGSKKNPFYKIVAMESLMKRNGKIFMQLGYYNPLNKELKINLIQFYHLLKNGAYPTHVVRHLVYKNF